MPTDENILNIQTTFQKGENSKIIEINNLKYKKYFVFSPAINTFWNIDNISPELNNNRVEAFFFTTQTNRNLSTGYFNPTLNLTFNYGTPNLPNIIDNFGIRNIKILDNDEISAPLQKNLNQAETSSITFLNNLRIQPVTNNNPGINIINPIYENDNYGQISTTNPFYHKLPVFISPTFTNPSNSYLTFRLKNTSPYTLSGMIFFEYDQLGNPIKNRNATLQNNLTGNLTDSNTFNYTNMGDRFSFSGTFYRSYAVFPRSSFRFMLFIAAPVTTNQTFLDEVFTIGYAPFNITDNLFNLIKRKYYLTTRDVEFRSMFVENQFYNYGTLTRIGGLLNLLLPSFPTNQAVLQSNCILDGSTGNFGISPFSPLFGIFLNLGPGSNVWNLTSTNGAQKAFGSYYTFILKTSNSAALSLDQFMDLYKNSTQDIYQSNGKTFELKNEFNIPTFKENCIISTPFIASSELSLIKNSLIDQNIKITVYQIRITEGDENMFVNLSNIRRSTFKLKEFATLIFNGSDHSSIYFKFPSNILNLSLVGKQFRLVDTITNTTQLSPVFLSDTEIIFYGLNSSRTYKMTYVKINTNFDEQDVHLISYRGLQNLTVLKKEVLTTNNYSIFTYNQSSYFIIQVENFVSTTNDISNLFISSMPENYLTSDEITLTQNSTLLKITLDDFYTNNELKLVTYTNPSGINIARVNYNYFNKNVVTNKYDYFFEFTTPLQSNFRSKISIINYQKSFTPVTLSSSLSSKPKKVSLIPQGWYSGIDAVNYLISILKFVTGLNEITFNQFTNKLLFTNSTNEDIFLIFTIPTSIFQESSSVIFGFKDPIAVIPAASQTFSPFEMDLYFNGRFSQIKINLLNFSNFGFINESLTLIKLIAKDKKGTLSTNQFINFIKMLPPNIVLSNLSFQVVDNRNLLVQFNESIDLEFLIRCVND
jgi:hypothetical protein